jgi:hypothetical protein
MHQVAMEVAANEDSSVCVCVPSHVTVPRVAYYVAHVLPIMTVD